MKLRSTRLKKDRADRVLASLGLAESRQKAQALIMAGLVFAGGHRVEKPGQMLDSDQDIEVRETLPFVSRGGLKLDEALDAFAISTKGKIAADLGASTGGFTDCLLQRGAHKVYAVDVDSRQLDVRLREDPRVVVVEKNARYLEREDVDDRLDIVTIDLSFISVLKVLPAVKDILDEGWIVSLIKPQFEVGRHQVGKKGIVRDLSLHEEVLVKIVEEAEGIGFSPQDVMRPSIRGQKGNQEYFILWKKKGTADFFCKKGDSPSGTVPAKKPAVPFSAISDIIKEAVRDERD